jgi:hypothetical protein
MSLLLSQASSYTESVSPSKKNPRMQSTYDNIQREYKDSTSTIHEGFQEQQKTQTEREKIVQNILNNTQNMSDESGLASYNPLVPPFKLPQTGNIPKITDGFQNPAYASSSSSSSSSSSMKSHGGSNYSDSYAATPYYKGLSSNSNSNSSSPQLAPHNSQLMEKLNYMIRLLEEQQKEPTQNIMEEFVLYGLLGVFMIYLVDSFARAGKYIR